VNHSRVVKKPRKNYRCYACGNPIVGAHIYNVSVIDGEFYYGRFHKECDFRCSSMCNSCAYSNDCIADLKTCFNEKYDRSNK
jgi:hypothetical protein